MSSISTNNLISNFEEFWKGDSREKNVLLNEKNDKQHPYNLISISTLKTDSGTEKLIGKIMGDNNFGSLTMPGVAQNHGLDWNANESTESIIPLISKSVSNVVVDTVCYRIFSDNAIILKKFEDQVLGQKFEINAVIEKGKWKKIIPSIIKEPVRRELEAYKKV